MGGLLHLFDMKHGSMRRKVLTHKRHDGDFEAPRNGLDLPLETSQRNYAGRYSMQHFHRATNDWPVDYSADVPMKRLISEEIYARLNRRHGAPSVVARLMGVDMLPVDMKPIRQAIHGKNEGQVSNFAEEGQLQNSYLCYNSHTCRSKRFDSIGHKEITGAKQRKNYLHWHKPKSREHPQEEELRKFKKEFEAWQTARFREYSKAVELGNIPSQFIAEEDLHKEKMNLYGNFVRPESTRKPLEESVKKILTAPHKGGSMQHLGKNKYLATGLESPCFSSKIRSPDFQQCSLTSFNNIPDVAYAPSKIVILRPGSDTVCCNEESWSSSGISEDRGSIEDFLEEVKERLKHEIQGKSSKRVTMARGGGIETPYSEKSSDAKHIAQCIAKQARESATGESRMTLLRSASSRSYGSEAQFSGTDSSEFINWDTRRFLTERLRNILKEEKHQDTPIFIHGNSRVAKLNDGRHRAELSSVFNAGNKARHWDSLTNESDKQRRSFRRDPDDNEMHQEDLSPRNLIRSLSAPVSRTSFGKLLLEDRHMLTGAHIRRKHEVIEKITLNVKNRKKEKFNFREKVSSFRYSLTLRGRLFRKNIQSVEVSNCDRVIKEILNEPPVMMNYYDRLENSTEVPPSPASICSSSHEEFYRPEGYFSSTPTSTPEVHPIEDSTTPQVFREISCNLNELRKQLNQLEAEGSEGTNINEQQNEFKISEIEDEMEIYIRDLLDCCGLYHGLYGTSLSRWDPLVKSISNQVFEEVEESYKQRIKDDEGSIKNQGDKLNHKFLFDLLNEVLPIVLGTPAPISRFKRKAIVSKLHPLQRRKLLDHVWEVLRDLLYPSNDTFFYSIDNMVDQDFQSTPWSKLIDDEVNTLGKEIECQIIADLIDETVEDEQC